MATKRFRLQYLFWLNIKNPSEHELAETIDQLKQEKSFTRTIRDGIRLIVSLRQRRTDVLLSMFPFLTEELQVVQPRLGETHKSDLSDQLKRIEKLIKQTNAAPDSPKPDGGLQKITSQSFDRPVLGDDDDMPTIQVRKAETSNSNATQNFLNSLSALQ